MKGLELSREFFMKECLPRIEAGLPQILPYLAAGLVGEGSECFGYDDEKSRDHDWGAAFCIWLPPEEGKKYAEALLRIVDSLPDRYLGFPVKKHGNGRTGIFGIGRFYLNLIGRRTAPETADDWLAIPEPKLAAAVNGEVFLDNYGEFSNIRKILADHYPEDVRLRCIAENMAMAAQTGQYNYPRSLSREDPLASAMMRSHFVSYAANLVFLLNRRYRPFYKWKYRAMKELPILGEESYARMTAILGGADKGEGIDCSSDDIIQLIEDQSAAMIRELRSQGLIESPGDFMLDLVRDVLMKIQDKDLLAKPLSLVL